jgi:signal transduction histidine kinase
MRFKLRPFITVLILLTLLPLLAYLQYRWQGQVSEALRSQLQEQMRRAAGQFSEDFDREMGRVYENFQVNLPIEINDEGNPDALRRKYIELYSRWLQIAPHQSLVSDIYLLTEMKEAPSTIEHLRPDNLQFESIAFPEDLRPLFLTSTLKRGLSVSVVRMNTETGKLVQLAPAIDRRVPAIAISIADSKMPFQKGRTVEFRSAPQPVAEAIVRLNLKVIRDELIPALAAKYLANADGTSAYSFAVIDRTGKQVVAANRADMNLNTTGDIAVPIFGSDLLDFPKAFVASVIEAHGDNETQSEKRSRLEFIQQDSQKFIGSVLDVGATPWQLVLTHQAGSLDAAVERARIENLAIGFGILILLGVSMGLTLVSVQRERRLAERQMEFVSAVSHELRTPLAVICSAGENLADGVVENPDQTKEYGALVRNEGRRLAEMVEQVLDFAGIQSGRKTYRFESLQVREIIDRALDTFEIPIRENGMAVEKRVPLQLPDIRGDRSALIRAVQNLIANALKYGSSGNWLSLRAESKPPFVTIVVEDRGPGITHTDLLHVFEPFYRARTVVDAQIKGTGLGLSLVKQILDAHGATVTVDSIPNKSTSFTIAIPVATAQSDVVLSQPQDGETYPSR